MIGKEKKKSPSYQNWVRVGVEEEGQIMWLLQPMKAYLQPHKLTP